MYCSKCGKQIYDDAIVCIGCGRLINDSSQKALEFYSTTPISQPNPTSSLATTAYVFMIIGMVILALCTFGIALAWCLPMILSYNSKIHNGMRVSTGFKVCTLLFVSAIAGIIMLCDKE